MKPVQQLKSSCWCRFLKYDWSQTSWGLPTTSHGVLFGHLHLNTNKWGGERKNNRIKDKTIQASQRYFKEILPPFWNKASVASLVPHDTPSWSLTGFFHKPTLRSKVTFTLQAPFELFCMKLLYQAAKKSQFTEVFLCFSFWQYMIVHHEKQF